jgi:hypothetical protein
MVPSTPLYLHTRVKSIMDFPIELLYIEAFLVFEKIYVFEEFIEHTCSDVVASHKMEYGAL